MIIFAFKIVKLSYDSRNLNYELVGFDVTCIKTIMN